MATKKMATKKAATKTKTTATKKTATKKTATKKTATKKTATKKTATKKTATKKAATKKAATKKAATKTTATKKTATKKTAANVVDPESVRVEIVARLRDAADPTKAKAMQAYMKTTMEFWGVAHPVIRSLCREVFSHHAVQTRDNWLAVALHLWRKATRREEWFAAIEWTGVRAARAWQQPEVLPLYEEMIVSSAWWDTVDVIAAHRVGPLLKNDPATMKPILRRWASDDDLWKRRTAILAQLHFKQDCDLELLWATMAPSLTRKEFWLRKAIGWALRHQARTHEEPIVAFVRAHKDELSGLSKREALKHIPEQKRAGLL